MKELILVATMFILASCASSFDRYKEKTEFNTMQCQQLCSSGNVIQVEKFGCACNLNNRTGSENQNQNRNQSMSNGNVINYYNSAPSQGQEDFYKTYMRASQILMDSEDRRLQRGIDSMKSGGNYNQNQPQRTPSSVELYNNWK